MAYDMTKDPQAVLEYGFDWSAWLATVTDTITTSTWAATGSDTALIVGVNTHDTTSTTVWLSGGTVQTVYKVTNHITTAGGRQDDRTIKVRIADR